jgi:hemolysin activation/secretion protein
MNNEIYIKILLTNFILLLTSGIIFPGYGQANFPVIPNPVTPNQRQPQGPLPPPPQENPLQINPPETNPSENNFDNSSETVSEIIDIKGFKFTGNTEAVMNQKKLCKVLEDFFLNQPPHQKSTSPQLSSETKDCLINIEKTTFSQLLQAASKITALYIKEGYGTSGAYIPAQDIKDGIIKIQIVEGSLQEIRIGRKGDSTNYLNDNYIRSRIALATAKPLNLKNLQEALQLLGLNPLIKSVSAELSAGTKPGTNLLRVLIEEENRDKGKIIVDNSRNPSVGTFRRGIERRRSNLTGIGDSLNLAYENTDGSNAIDISYTVPINPRNGSISLSYGNTNSNIVEPPFNDLDIDANSSNLELSLRQPIVQNANDKFIQEIALGLTFSHRESNTSISDVNFPISLGADAQGNTRISALRFFQDWTKSSLKEVFSAKSQFSLGLGVFDATINNKEPDSRFFAWRGQFFWLRSLSRESENQKLSPKLLIKSDVQLANRALLPLEQFTLGGIYSVRGYRQDAIFSDNGIFASADFQLPIYSNNNQKNILQLIPFIDIGTTWNSSNIRDSTTNTLASLGLGVEWKMDNKFSARLDYGIPLIDIQSRNRTWQENGFYFSLQYNPF